MKPNYFILGNNTLQEPEDHVVPEEVITFTISDKSKEFTINIGKDRAQKLFNNIKESFSAFEKEPFYIRAVQNLLKTKKFLNLNLQLMNNEISDEEYDAEIEGSKKDYAIVQRKNPPIEELRLIYDATRSIDPSLSTSEVSQIFGIEHNCLVEFQQKQLER
jgi:hypothetical protein